MCFIVRSRGTPRALLQKSLKLQLLFIYDEAHVCFQRFTMKHMRFTMKHTAAKSM